MEFDQISDFKTLGPRILGPKMSQTRWESKSSDSRTRAQGARGLGSGDLGSQRRFGAFCHHLTLLSSLNVFALMNSIKLIESLFIVLSNFG